MDKTHESPDRAFDRLRSLRLSKRQRDEEAPFVVREIRHGRIDVFFPLHHAPLFFHGELHQLGGNCFLLAASISADAPPIVGISGGGGMSQEPSVSAGLIHPSPSPKSLAF